VQFLFDVRVGAELQRVMQVGFGEKLGVEADEDDASPGPVICVSRLISKLR